MIKPNIAWFALMLVTGLLSASCTTTQPTVDTSPGAELSYDGLSPVQDARVSKLWVRPDFDLDGYTKLQILGAGLHYRPVKKTSRAGASRTNEFPLDDTQKARLEKIVSEEFNKALSAQQRYQIVDSAGPDVLQLRGALLDVVSRIPPDQPGRSDFYLDTVGEATLLVELADSQSGTTLVRILDRRAARQVGVAYASNPVTNASEARRLARTWANRLADGLEQVSDVYSMGTTR